MTTPIETVEQQRVQAQRIETILSALIDPTQYRSAYLYMDDGISFRVDDAATGQILCEAYSPTSAREIQGMSDERIENRLKEMFAETHHLLYLVAG